MKRLVWLFLAIFCTALAQVQPVEPLLPKAKSECCCESDGACGMPECTLPPAAAQQFTALERSRTELRQEVRRETARLPQLAPKFYLSALKPVVAITTLSAPAEAAPAASPPLFRVHCSFLI